MSSSDDVQEFYGKIEYHSFEKGTIGDTEYDIGIAEVVNRQGQKYEIRVSGSKTAIMLYAEDSIFLQLDTQPVVNYDQPDYNDQQAELLLIQRHEAHNQLEQLHEVIERASLSELFYLRQQLNSLSGLATASEEYELHVSELEMFDGVNNRLIEITPLLELEVGEFYQLSFTIDPINGEVDQGKMDIYVPKNAKAKSASASVSCTPTSNPDLEMVWGLPNQPKTRTSTNGEGKSESIPATRINGKCELRVKGIKFSVYTLSGKWVISRDDIT